VFADLSIGLYPNTEVGIKTDIVNSTAKIIENSFFERFIIPPPNFY
jgi:hypothetical protein